MTISQFPPEVLQELANLSHDAKSALCSWLRSKLTPIVGNTQLAATDENAPVAVRKYLSSAFEVSEQLIKEFEDDILNVSRRNNTNGHLGARR